MCPLPIDWPERARRALPRDVASSHTAGDLASALEAWVEDQSAASSREALSLLIEYVAASAHLSAERAERALAWGAEKLAPQYQASDIVPGWDPDLRVLFDTLASHAPELLKRDRERFPDRARNQLDFALALVGLGAWPEQAMAAVARRYLNSPPGTFAYEGRVPLSVLSEATRRLLRCESVPLLQWSRLSPLLVDADDELRFLFLVNYCGEHFRSRAMELARSAGAQFDGRLEDALAGGKLSFAGAIAAALVLTRRKGRQWREEIPAAVRQALLWDLRSGTGEEASVSLEAYSQLSEALAAQLLRECLREERAIALIPAVADDQVIIDLLTRLETESFASPVVVDALVACGPRVVPLLEAACRRKQPPANVAAVCAEVLGALGAGLGVLVPLLGHPSKRVTAAASRALELLGSAARSELEAGTAAPKKAMRAHCERLLTRLVNEEQDERTPLFDVKQRSANLSQEAREAFVAAFSTASARGAGEGEAIWHDELKSRVQQLGAVALDVLRDWYTQKVTDGETRLWCYAVEELRNDAEAVWVAVDTFCRMPKLSASLWARPRRSLGHCGALLGPPVVYCLHNVHTEYREVLYGLLAGVATAGAHEVFLAGLRDPSKAVRTHSVDGLSRMADPPVADVAQLLSGQDIGTRIAVAELLAVWGRQEAAPQVVEAWTRERSALVRPYLEDTLVACGREDVVFTSGEQRAPAETDVERFLCAQTLPKKLPPFVKLDDAPPLHFVSGTPLSGAACHGLLARLMLLDSTLKGRATRRLLQLLQAADVHAWGQWIYDGWARARNPKHKWAVLQLSLLATPELLDRAMAPLGSWRGTEHTAIQCHLRAAQWHGSERAVQWLGYWSETLTSLGARSMARQLLGRVAFKQGRSLREIRKQVPPFLAEEFEERQLEAAYPPGYLRSRQAFELGRAWLSGRTWTGEQLLRLLALQSYLGAEGWLFRAGPAPGVVVPNGTCRYAVGKLLDATGLPVSLEQVFWLAHPLDTRDEEFELYSSSLSREPDMALMQRHRETYRPDQMQLLLGQEVPPERFSRFRRRWRWFHGEPMDAGIVYSDSLHLLGRGLVVTLHHSGYGIGAAELDEAVRFMSLDFSDLDGAPLEAEQLPPIVYSELHRSLALLVAGED